MSVLIIRPYAKISKNWVLLEQGRNTVSVIMRSGNGKNIMRVSSKIENSHIDSHTKDERVYGKFRKPFISLVELRGIEPLTS